MSQVLFPLYAVRIAESLASRCAPDSIDSMIRIFKQKGLAFAAAALLGTCQLHAQPVLSQWDRGSLGLRISPALKLAVEPGLPALSGAMDRINALFSPRTAPAPLVIWLVHDETERAAVLKQLGAAPAQGPHLRSASQVVVTIPAQTDSGWILRFVAAEYARYLLSANSREDGREWFRQGLAVCFGWFAVEEQEGGSWASALTKVNRYYATRVTPGTPSFTIESLTTPGQWKQIMQGKDRVQAIGRSVLISAWIAEKGGPGGALNVLSMWEQTNKLEDSLTRGAGVSMEALKERETQLNSAAP